MIDMVYDEPRNSYIATLFLPGDAPTMAWQGEGDTEREALEDLIYALGSRLLDCSVI